MKLQNPFRIGLLGGLGVVVAIALGQAVAELATVLTYVGAAIFLALGLDPLISWLETRGFPRWLAILTALVGVLGLLTGLVLAVTPLIARQVNNLIQQIPDLIEIFTDGTALQWVNNTFPWLPAEDLRDQALEWAASGDNITSIFGGVLQTAGAIANGVFGGIVVLILTIYFTASLNNLKRNVYQLVPASRRERFVDIAEQVAQAVGRWVVGDVTLALTNGILSFVFLSIIRAEYPALFAFIAFLFSLVPLVGTITGSFVIVLAQWILNPESPPTVITAAIYYLVYMQVEAYVLAPRIMNRAVRVPGVLVIIAALIGGTLLGILGALVAIPVAAAVLIVVRQVLVPRQNTL